MKRLVCISKTPDTTAPISFSSDGTTFNSAGVQYILNPYDEWYALVRAVELKEKQGGTVTVLHVGLAENDQIIRKALAIGGDDAIRVNADPKSAFFTAKQIAEVAQSGGYEVVFCGKETIDYNASEVGAMVAECLEVPFISYATHMEVNGQTATITRDVEGGSEVVEVVAPFVVSAAKGMAEQRIPNMRGIMMAKNKPLKVVEPITVENPVSVVQYSLPPAKQGVKMVSPEDMDELVRLLHEEAKVI
ncbi:MAG TPA: electron transfer flavoprotein subunit beta/FixA family protein [Rhodothermales bacterium]|nr:electron transfer flavoprotein subunit alpha [Bacteroidota bacterium]HRK74218.1 electron transfer flavoprotein subunit beta/FixA family protein [Rhodothermales bacterium]HRR09263.1 electron transfer flavoprotein subunit beta/FixA family protein [Rhodothermales bacterium]